MRLPCMEKESIAFYTGIMELVPPEIGKDRVAEIIREEMRHVTMLTAQLAIAV
jgi:rubrerythrin